MKWAVYLIRHKDTKAGKDVYVGRLEYRGDELERSLKRRLEIKKQYIERDWDRGIRIKPDFELYKRMQEAGLENWEIVPLANVNSYDDSKALVKMMRDVFKPDLNEFWRPPRRNL